MNKNLKTKPSRNVFRRAKSRKNTPLWRQSLESLLMVNLGVILLLYLNRIPNKLNLSQILRDSGIKFYESIIGLLQSTSIILSLVILFVFIFIGLILLLGGLWRSLRVVSLLIRKSKKRKY